MPSPAAPLSPCASPGAASLLRPPINGNGFGDYSLHDFAAKWMMQQDDIPEIGRHRAANQALIAGGDPRPRIVCFGDSITDQWRTLEAESTAQHLVVNRGIGGQNTSQMVLRFQDDVAALEPAVAVILGGTNDLRAYVGDPVTAASSALARIARNLTAMADMGRGRGVQVVLATLPPVGADREKVNRDAAAIRAANSWIADFATARGYSLADYHTALADEHGALPIALSDDGVHPNAAGYALMRPVLAGALARIGIDLFAPEDSLGRSPPRASPSPPRTGNSSR